jgi:hypothetical protein
MTPTACWPRRSLRQQLALALAGTVRGLFLQQLAPSCNGRRYVCSCPPPQQLSRRWARARCHVRALHMHCARPASGRATPGARGQPRHATPRATPLIAAQQQGPANRCRTCLLAPILL